MCQCYLMDFSPSLRQKIDYYFFIRNDSNWGKMNIFDEFKLWGGDVTIDQSTYAIKCIKRWRKYTVMKKYHRFFCNDDRMLMIFPSELWLKVSKLISHSSLFSKDVSKLDRFLSIDNHLLIYKDPSSICDPNDPPMWIKIPLRNIDRKFIKNFIQSLIQNRKSDSSTKHHLDFVDRLKKNE